MPPIRSSLGDAAYRTFVDHLLSLRREAGITQVQLAEALGQPQSYVSKTERFERRMDVAEFRAWVLALGASPVAEFSHVSGLLDSPPDDPLAATD